ncbi:LexA/Signal peptidase [Ramaria rubella]|nr:LexA/Signal peptidase [Ramaria rubella]
MSVVWQRVAFLKTARFTINVVKGVCAYHLFAENVGNVRIVHGPSMLPTMRSEGELVLEDTLSLRLSPFNISRGDLVTFQSPMEPEKTVCKRVMGLPGDTVCLYPERAILINGCSRAGNNTEAQHGRPLESQHVLVPKGHIWISGDNTSNSRDSRAYGPIPIALVRGKIFARVYPAPRWFCNPVTYID